MIKTYLVLEVFRRTDVTETASDDPLNLITDVIVEKANVPDTEFVQPAIESTAEVTGQAVEKAYVDDAYAICHLAALSNDPMGALNEKLTYEINHKAFVNIAKIAKKVGVEKYIFSASCSMYGISDGNKALDETAKLEPVTAYAKSKVNTEKGVMPLENKDFSVTFLRNATAYGLSPKLRLDLVVNNLVGWAITTGKIKIMNDGTPWRPLTHSEDIARAFIAVIESPKKKVNQ